LATHPRWDEPFIDIGGPASDLNNDAARVGAGTMKHLVATLAKVVTGGTA
jgi:hypothetical protein